MKKNGCADLKIALGVMPAFMGMQTLFIMNPAIAGMAELFPHIPYSTILLLSTMPLVVSVPITILCGSLVGSRFRYRTMTILGFLLLIVSGAIPYFLQDFYVILFSRAIFGIGIGIATPLGNALVAQFWKGEKAARMQGAGTVLMNLSGVFFQLLSGVVCAVNPRLVWPLHLILLVPFIFALVFLPEPDSADRSASKAPKQTRPLKPVVYIESISFGVIFMFYYTMLLNMSTILTEEHIGNSATAGTILSMYTIGGILSGLVFSRLYKAAGRFTIPICFVIWIAGMAAACWSASVPVLIVATGLTGLAKFLLWPAIISDFSKIMPPSDIARATGWYLAWMAFGGFMASFLIGAVFRITGNPDPRLPLRIGLAAMVLLCGLWTAILLLSGRKKQTPASAENSTGE